MLSGCILLHAAVPNYHALKMRLPLRYGALIAVHCLRTDHAPQPGERSYTVYLHLVQPSRPDAPQCGLRRSPPPPKNANKHSKVSPPPCDAVHRCSFLPHYRSGVATSGNIANFFRDAGKRAGKAPARPTSSAAPSQEQFGLAGLGVVQSSQGHAAAPPSSALASAAGSIAVKAKKRLCLSRSKQRSRSGKTKMTAVAGAGAELLKQAASAAGRHAVEPPRPRVAKELSTKRLSLGASADRPAKRGCGPDADGMLAAVL